MEHEIKEESKATIFTFSGDMDLQHSPTARRVLLAGLERNLPILVDLSKVDYIDSSGIASLVETLQGAKKKGIDFALVAVSEPAMRVLKLARLDQVFTLYGSMAEALAAAG